MDTTQETTEEKARRIIAEHLVRNINEVKLESNFKDLGADSLDTVEIIMELEREFNIKIDDTEMEKISSVGDAINLITSKI